MASERIVAEKTSPFITHFPVLFKLATSYNAETGEFILPFLLYIIFAFSMVIIIDLSALVNEGITEGIFNGKAHEALIFIYNGAHVPMIIMFRENFSILIKFLTEDFNTAEHTPAHDKVLKKYVISVDLFGKTFVINNLLVVAGLSYMLTPLLNLPFYIANHPVHKWPLPVGRIPFHTESVLVYLLSYAVFSSAMIAVALIYSAWFLVMFYASFKIKAKLKMLALDLKNLDERAAARMASSLKKRLAPSHYAQLTVYNDVYKGIVNDLLVQFVKEHLVIMKICKVLEKTFRLSLLWFMFMAIPISTILAGHIADIAVAELRDIVAQVNMVFTTIVSLLLISYCGEIIITESENLRTAVYSSNWVDKHKGLKRSMLIVLVVTSRTLRITAGSLYPVRMESCTTTLQAICSYLNILLTMKYKI